MTFLEATASRRNNFDFIRLLLASLVILTHSFFLLQKGQDPLGFLTHNQRESGTAAVEFFFVISGFLIANSWQHSKTAMDYLKKRILRIYPGYIAAVLVTVFVLGLLGADSPVTYLHSIPLKHLFVDILRLHKIVSLPTFAHNPLPGNMNGSLWSIAIEFECYLLIMLFGWAGLLRQPGWTLALSGFCSLLCVGLLYPAPGLHQLCTHLPAAIGDKLVVTTCFLWGTTAYLYRDKIRISPGLFWVSLAILILTAVTTGFIVAMMIFGSYILFYGAFSPRVKLYNWGKRADLSYGTYLYGWPIQQLLIVYMGKSLNPYVLTLIALALAYLCATLSWCFIERPFLRLKPGEESGQRDRGKAQARGRLWNRVATGDTDRQ